MQKIRPSRQRAGVVPGSWEATFPASVDTETESLVFIKRATYLVVSYILQLRNLLPQDAFKKRKLEDMHFRVLSGATPLSAKVGDNIRSACTAIDHKYLKEMMLVINNDPAHPESVVEVYVFSYTYCDKEGTALRIIDAAGRPIASPMKYRDTASVRRQTASLIQRLVALIGTLEPLPEGCVPYLKLSYYEERTPIDYEPPGFAPSVMYHFTRPHTENLRMGRINTKFHGVHVKVESLFIDDAVAAEERAAIAIDAGVNKAQNMTTTSSPSGLSEFGTPFKVQKRRRVTLDESSDTAVSGLVSAQEQVVDSGSADVGVRALLVADLDGHCNAAVEMMVADTVKVTVDSREIDGSVDENENRQPAEEAMAGDGGDPDGNGGIGGPVAISSATAHNRRRESRDAARRIAFGEVSVQDYTVDEGDLSADAKKLKKVAPVPNVIAANTVQLLNTMFGKASVDGDSKKTKTGKQQPNKTRVKISKGRRLASSPLLGAVHEPEFKKPTAAVPKRRVLRSPATGGE